MGSYLVGTTAVLEAEFTNWNTGANTDVDSIVCKIFKDGKLIASIPTASIAHMGTGKYQYGWQIPETYVAGLYVYTFMGKYANKPVGNDAIIRVRVRKTG